MGKLKEYIREVKEVKEIKEVKDECLSLRNSLDRSERTIVFNFLNFLSFFKKVIPNTGCLCFRC